MTELQPVQIALREKYRRPRTRGRFRADYAGRSGKHRARRRQPTDYDPRDPKNAKVYDALRGKYVS